MTGELGTLGSYLQVSPLPTIVYRSSVERIASACPFDLDRPPTLVNPAFQTVFKSESFKRSTYLRSWDGFVSHVERLVNRWYTSRRNGVRTIPNEIIRTDSVKAGTHVDGYFGLNGESGKDNLSKTEWNASIISSDDKSSTLLVLTLTPESLARMTTLQPAHSPFSVSSSSSSPGTRTRHRKLPSEIVKTSNEFGIVLPEREDEVDGEEDGGVHAQNVPVETTSDERPKPTDPLEPIPLGSSATYYTEQTHLVPGVSAKVHPSVLSRFALAAPVGMVLATTSARIIWANDEWFKVVGLKRGDHFDTWIDLVDPAYVPLMLNTLGDVLEERQLTNIQLRWKDGRWANFTTQCDYDENGTFIGLMATILDVTQRKEAELAEIDNLVKKEAEARKMAEEMIERSRQLAEANTKNQELQRQRNMLAKMAEVSTTGLTIAYPNGTIRWGNQAYYEMHGLNSQMKDEWEHAIVPTDLDKLKFDFAEAIRTQTPLRSRHRLTNGRTVDAISVPDFSANTPEGAPYIGSITDVTNQVASEVAIQRLSDQRVAEADQRRRDAIFQKEQQSLLVDVVSHELRNAINPILQSSLLIKNSLIMAHAAFKKGLDGDQMVPVTELNMQHMMEDLEACDAIIDSATQMERVANDVLGLAQIQLNQLDVTPVPFNLDTQIKNIYRMFQADCRAKDVSLKVHMGESLKLLGSGYMIKADPSRLQQTVVNLCSNAIKFTAKQDVREITLQVEVSTRPPVDSNAILPPRVPLPDSVPEDTPLFIYISVHDTGPGMTEEELAKLFRKFSQANNEIHVQMGGNGLGLFIAKQLCKLQHGAIEAVSRKGKHSGSTFRFYIAAKSVVAPVEIPRSNSMPRLPSTIENLVPLHILVVDDNVINRKTLDRQLKIHKHTVKTAEDGQQALNVIEAQEANGTPFDCILLDVNMPVMDGVTCARRLREMETRKNHRFRYWIVGCTGNARPEQVQSVLEAGMNTVITKPYRLPALLEAIRQPIKLGNPVVPLESV